MHVCTAQIANSSLSSEDPVQSLEDRKRIKPISREPKKRKKPNQSTVSMDTAILPILIQNLTLLPNLYISPGPQNQTHCILGISPSFSYKPFNRNPLPDSRVTIAYKYQRRSSFRSCRVAQPLWQLIKYRSREGNKFRGCVPIFSSLTYLMKYHLCELLGLSISLFSLDD